MTDNSLLRRKTVLARTGISKSEMYRLIRAGKFPRQESIGGKMVAWRAAEIEQWLLNPVGYEAGT